MKNQDVKVGETYLTKIGDVDARVVVVQRRIGVPFMGKKERDTFDVRRENEDRVLPKPRSAAALHPLPHGTQPARLDTNGTAKPLTSIVGHALGGTLQGPGITIPDTYRDSTGKQIPLK